MEKKFKIKIHFSDKNQNSFISQGYRLILKAQKLKKKFIGIKIKICSCLSLNSFYAAKEFTDHKMPLVLKKEKKKKKKEKEN